MGEGGVVGVTIGAGVGAVLWAGVGTRFNIEDCNAARVGELVDAGVGAGEKSPEDELLDFGECAWPRRGPESTCSLLRRPSFCKASLRTFWGSIITLSLGVRLEVAW